MGSEQQETSAAAGPVGQQLQRARELKGLSISEIADQQHLRSSIIQAIEAGDYSKIDTELFLKGYIRAYARQVDLDGDALIRDLDAELAPIRQQREEEQQAHPLANIERRRERKRQLAKALLVVILLALAGYGAFYFLSGQDAGLAEEPAEATDSVEVPSEQAVAGSPLTEGSEEEAGPAEETEFSVSVEESANEVSEQVPPVVDGAPSEEQLEQPEPTIVSGDDVDLQEGTGLPVTAEQQSAIEPEAVPAEPEVAQSASSSTARLEMTFSADCWIQVTDATGQRLASALRREGDRLDVTGVPPLKVVVGAMNAVEAIQFQGEPLEMDSFRVVNNRSEFTLEP